MIELNICDDLLDLDGQQHFVIAVHRNFVVVGVSPDGIVKRWTIRDAMQSRAAWLAAHPDEIVTDLNHRMR
jgi:hypothetical protein